MPNRRRPIPPWLMTGAYRWTPDEVVRAAAYLEDVHDVVPEPGHELSTHVEKPELTWFFPRPRLKILSWRIFHRS